MIAGWVSSRRCEKHEGSNMGCCFIRHSIPFVKFVEFVSPRILIVSRRLDRVPIEEDDASQTSKTKLQQVTPPSAFASSEAGTGLTAIPSRSMRSRVRGNSSP